MALLVGVHGTTIQRAMIPVVPYDLLWSLKAWYGIESMPALPRLLFSAEVLRQLLGFHAQQLRQGMCQRRATTRPGRHLAGPIYPETLAKNIVKPNGWALEVLFHGVIRALAKMGVLGAWAAGMLGGTDAETIARPAGCDQVIRKVPIRGKRRRMQAIEVSVYGWKGLLVIDAATKIPLPLKVGPMDEPATQWTRALLT
jgi:hypothetical protein